MKNTTTPLDNLARLGPRGARSLVAAVAIALAAPLVGLDAFAAEIATLDRPTFDRNEAAVLVPFSGPAPRFTTDIRSDGLLLEAIFSGSAARLPTAYRLGLFHPVVSKVEMASLGQGRVKVTIHATQPSELQVVPDVRRGVMRLMVTEPSQVPTATPPPVANIPGMTPLSPTPPSIRPQPMPSTPPTAYKNEPAVGTPSSGEYVYRKAIPTGRDEVTEVEVRSRQKANILVNQDPRSDSVIVNVLRQGEGNTAPAAIAQNNGGYVKQPLPNQPWKMPDRSAEATYRPVAAVNSLVGMALMTEQAATYGSTFTGQGATLWGLAGHLPLGPSMNFSVAGEGFAYGITSRQVPDAVTRRNEYYGRAQFEYLAVRRPWVLAIGPGYWMRYVQTTTTEVLPPTDPSLLFVPTLMHHGPSANARVFYPLWDALGLEAEAGIAPFLMNGGDSVSTSLGGLFGTQESIGLKWGTRHLSVFGGVRHQGFYSYSPGFMFHRGGPEVSLVWRF